MDTLKIRSLGPIEQADIQFGDLTFFVGPQASGKSIVLQLVKLLIDRDQIEQTLQNYGFVWDDDLDNNMERFFGEGMAKLWLNGTDVIFNEIDFKKEFLKPGRKNHERLPSAEKIFYIPAQRVLCLNNGWPRFFNDFDDSAPYVLRDFSESLRLSLESGSLEASAPLFAEDDNHMVKRVEDFAKGIFLGGRVTVDRLKRKRLMLEIENMRLPFTNWSTGQKESFPLFAGLYMMSPLFANKMSDTDYIIVEEPEMGLHPEAIKSVILQIFGLMQRGYKIIVSTHSPVLLEFAWAFNILKHEKALPENFDALFDLNEKSNAGTFFTTDTIGKIINTYYFEREKPHERVVVKNISSLDAGSSDSAVAEWGGLSSFASKAGDIVSTIVANNA